MDKAIDPFEFEGSNDRELTADLLAKRIAAMVDGTLARVYDSENDSWVDTTEEPVNTGRRIS